jgi:hypothetical protein
MLRRLAGFTRVRLAYSEFAALALARRAAAARGGGGAFIGTDIDTSLMNHPFWSDDGLPYDFGIGDEFSTDMLDFVPQEDQNLFREEKRK